jgi:phosphoglycolate phosphatase
LNFKATLFERIDVLIADVDGTLIHSTGEQSNKLHKLAFAHAFKEIFDIDTNIDVIKHHGSTDPLILVRILEYHGIAKAVVRPTCQR